MKLTGRDVPLSGLLRSVTRPICSFAVSLRDSIAQKQAQQKSVDELQAQVAQLQEQNAALQTQLAQKTGEDYADMTVRGLLPKGYASRYDLLQARVIGTDGKACPGTVTVNVGSRNGVTKYAPVMTSAGLVGYVSDVGSGWAKITTLADAAFSCGITDNVTGWSGVLRGTGSSSASATDTVEIRYTDENSLFYAGDLLVTSGVGSVFPAGLPIGTVAQINTRTYDRLITAKVTPLADITAQALTQNTLWLLIELPTEEGEEGPAP